MKADVNQAAAKACRLCIILVMLIFTAISATTPVAMAQTVLTKQWRVDDTVRQAIVYVPATAQTEPAPVVFVFHGHGGRMQNMFNQHRFRQLWPKAIIVAPQGLNTPGPLTDPDGLKPGWQHRPGDQHDRDLYFFDVMLKDLQAQYHIDTQRIYATGHSNGGGFVYLLWATRGNVLAAVAPSAAVAAPLINNRLQPKPVLHIMGKQDPLVKPAWQQLTINRLLQINQCHTASRPFGSTAVLYPSAIAMPVVVYQHPGGHVYPPEADTLVVDFFKSIKKP